MADIEDLNNLEEFEDLTNYSDDENDKLHQQIELKVGMKFYGTEELYEFTRKYAKTCEFSIRKRIRKEKC